MNVKPQKEKIWKVQKSWKYRAQNAETNIDSCYDVIVSCLDGKSNHLYYQGNIVQLPINKLQAEEERRTMWTVKTEAEGWTEQGKEGKERVERGIWRPSEPRCILSQWLTRPRWFLLRLYHYVIVRYDVPQCADTAICSMCLHARDKK